MKKSTSTTLSYIAGMHIPHLLDNNEAHVCSDISSSDNMHTFLCSECGAYLDIAQIDGDGFYKPVFCPNCGAYIIR